MTQPKFAPIRSDDEVRPGYRLEPPRPWSPHRPGELTPASGKPRPGGGNPGPDQGYVLLLVHQFDDSIVIAPGERREDVVAGAVAIALRRAALFGRAPVAQDLELALRLFGYLGPAAPDLVASRAAIFGGLDHDYARRRELAQAIPDEVLCLSPAAVGAREDWRTLLDA